MMSTHTASVEKMNILLVDDRPENLFTLESILEKPNRNFLHATSGGEALIMATMEPFGLILLDYQMPDMNGLDVALKLRADKRTAAIPIIFVSAVSRSERKMFGGFEEGTVDVLFKPIEMEDARLKVLLFEQIYFLKKQIYSMQHEYSR